VPGAPWRCQEIRCSDLEQWPRRALAPSAGSIIRTAPLERATHAVYMPPPLGVVAYAAPPSAIAAVAAPARMPVLIAMAPSSSGLSAAGIGRGRGIGIPRIGERAARAAATVPRATE
jgi:hypothetical protein